MATVTVRYFAVLREQKRREVETVTVEAGTTVDSLYEQLFPPGPEGKLPVAYARNEAYVDGDEAVVDGDEIAFIPPIGGG